MDKIELSDIQGNVKLADVKLSSLSLSADAVVGTINKVIDEVNSKGGGDFLPLSGGTLTGAVSSTNNVTVDGDLKSASLTANSVTVGSAASGKIEMVSKILPGLGIEFTAQMDVDGNISASGSLDLDGTANVAKLNAGKSSVGDLTCQSMVMTNYVDMMQNYCDKGGVIMSNMGKYTCFRDKGSAIMDPTPVGGCVGALGYCVLSACNDATTGKGVLKLSGDVTPLKEVTTTLGDKCKWSLTIGGAACCWNFTISSTTDVTADDGTVSAAMVYLKQAIDSDNLANAAGLKTEDDYLALWNNQEKNEDDCVFYSPFAVWAGNQRVPAMYNGMIEGNACRAIQRATHAEGRMCLADARYSHAEGSYSYATGIASHVEGYNNLASGYYSHAEGHSTTASASRSHAEGVSTKATAEAAHAEGGSSVASGKYSHAEGNLTYATGENAHSGGASTTASGTYAFAHGYKCTASGNSATATGYNCTAKSDYSVAGGYKTTAGVGVTGFKITAIDAANKIVTLDSLSCMWNGSPYYIKNLLNQTMKIHGFDDDYSKVETFSGMTFQSIVDATAKTVKLSYIPTFADTSTNKVMSFANDLFASIGNTYVFGQGQCAFGTSTQAKGSNSVAVGNSSVASGLGAYAGGYQAYSKGKYSMVWNGDPSTAKYGNTLSTDGLFCVNPVGGAEGFYIGTQTLSAIISAAVKAGIDNYKKSLTAG